MAQEDEKPEGTEPNDSEEATEEPAQKKIEDIEAELNKVRQDYLYLKAEFDNYKKQAIKERSDLLKYGAENLVRELLGVVDNFDRALSIEATPENIESYKQGVQMTASELKDVLDRFGVKAIDPQGQPFDPNIHEALSSEASDEMPPGHVLRVYKKAYKLHEKLIRPAQVVVSKTNSEQEENNTPEQ